MYFALDVCFNLEILKAHCHNVLHLALLHQASLLPSSGLPRTLHTAFCISILPPIRILRNKVYSIKESGLSMYQNLYFANPKLKQILTFRSKKRTMHSHYNLQNKNHSALVCL